MIVRLQLSTETTTKKKSARPDPNPVRVPAKPSPPPFLDDVLDHSSVATMFSLSLISSSEGFFYAKN